MSGNLKRLAGETVIYGASTMLGRFLNWLLMPFYIRTILPEEFGVIVNIYAVISILLVVFTYGIETGFFRFARNEYKNDVFKTSLIMLTITSLSLIFISCLAAPVISKLFYGGKYVNSLFLVGLIVAFDSFLSIPFANLRLKNKSFSFGIFKTLNILLCIVFNLLFLLIIPKLINAGLLNNSISEIYEKGNGVFYVLLSNALSSMATFFFFIKDFTSIKGSFKVELLKNLLKYSWPVLVVGITGMVIQNSDKVLMPKILGDNGFKELAVYGANFKIGVLMSLFIQSFRFAFEPYFFKNQEHGKESYAKVMEYFVFFGIFIFLGVTIFIDLINILLTPEYLYGNVVIPYVLIGQLFYGIYFNLSLWYKLTDRTYYGAIFGICGTIISITLNFVLIKNIGIVGGALSILIGYGIMMVVSFLIGQRYYRIPYSLKKILQIVVIGCIFFVLDIFITPDTLVLKYFIKIILIFMFVISFLFINKTLKFNSLIKCLK